MLSAARVFLALERAADARVLLEPFLQTAAGEQLAGHYLLARAYAALDLWDEALAQYDLYIASGRPAVPYAYLDRAAMLLERDEPLPAALSAKTGLGLGVPAGVRPDFILSAAESYEQADSFGDAISWYRELVTASGSASNDALALARIVAIKRDELNESYAVERDELIVSYPRTQQALDVLCDALERGETIAPTDRGLVYYRHNDYTEAEPHFREQIAVAPAALASAVAHYYLGAILESRQKDEEALTNYALVTNLNPTTFIAADSLSWQGRILEDQNRRDEAQALYARIVAQYSSSIWAADAAFRHGMLAYDAGQYLEANGLWATYQAAVLDPAERERLTLWQAKALLMAGQRDAAASLLEPLATAGEDDYYGIRALSLLTGAHGQPPATREQDVDLTPSFDWEEAEGWLSARTGRPVSDVGWSTDYRWLRAQELWRVGRTGMGDEEAFDLIDAHDQDPIATYTLARRLAEAGRVGMSGRAGQRLLRLLNANPNEGLPKALLSLSYPPAFGTLAAKHAQEAGISPLLLLAFVRLESFFDPQAESAAGALGLAQVLPSTGQTIAASLGLNGYERGDLLQADLNLRFGASYIARQLSEFGNEIFVALAAYNAGPNGARRWRSAAGDDADAFLEAVEFRETRLYVQLVAENYAIYRYLYGGEAKPTLPN